MRRRIVILCLCIACLLLAAAALSPPGALAVDPKVAGSCTLPYPAGDVGVAGNYAYVADDWGGLQVVDISSPTTPIVVGSCGLSNETRHVAVSGDFAYLVHDWVGLEVVDVSTPTAPVNVGSTSLPSSIASGVAAAGRYAYVAHGPYGLQVIDVASPTAPVVVGSCDLPGSSDVALGGDYAYVNAGRTLQVVDISTPATPVVVGSCTLPDDPSGVAVAGEFAYVSDGYGGFLVIDVGTPTAPAIVGSCMLPYMTRGVAVAGDAAYVADGFGGLFAIDVSNAVAPVVIGSCAVPEEAVSVAVAGRSAYVCAGFSLHVVDLSPAQLTGLTPDHAVPGATVVISGAGLGSGGTVTFGGVPAPTSAWSDTSITCSVPLKLADGPTSVTVTPSGGATTTALSFTVDGVHMAIWAKPAVVAYKGLVTVSGELHDGLGTPLPGTLLLQQSRDGTTWANFKSVSSATGSYTTTVAIVRKTYFRWSFAGDDTYRAAVGASCSATCRAKLTPPAVPSLVRHGVKYTAVGYLRPQHADGKAPLTITFFRYSGGSWHKIATVSDSRWKNVSGATKYGVVFAIAARGAGKWRVRAMHKDADHAQTYSAWRNFTVQ